MGPCRDDLEGKICSMLLILWSNFISEEVAIRLEWEMVLFFARENRIVKYFWKEKIKGICEPEMKLDWKRLCSHKALHCKLKSFTIKQVFMNRAILNSLKVNNDKCQKKCLWWKLCYFMHIKRELKYMRTTKSNIEHQASKSINLWQCILALRDHQKSYSRGLESCLMLLFSLFSLPSLRQKPSSRLWSICQFSWRKVINQLIRGHGVQLKS